MYFSLAGVNVTLSAEEEVDIIKVYHRLKQPNSVKGKAINISWKPSMLSDHFSIRHR